MITMTREEAQELLNALTMFCRPNEDQVDELVYEGAIELLRARLSAPEREWQSLTDEDLDDAYEAAHKSQSGAVVWSVTKYTEAIEAKLREKNT